MGKIQDAINQAFGLASPPSRDAQRGGGSNFTDKQARKAHKWLNKPEPKGKARGDRRGTPPRTHGSSTTASVRLTNVI